MATCAACGETVFFGKKLNGHSFCNSICAKAFSGTAAPPAQALGIGEQIFIALPIGLVLVGGLLGGLFGGVASFLNARVFKSRLDTPAKYALAAIITLGAGVCWLVAAAIFSFALKPPQ